MSETPHALTECPVCHKQHDPSQLIPGEVLRGPVVDTIAKHHPGWTREQSICRECLDIARAEYVHDALEEERGELSDLEHAVVASLATHDPISSDSNTEYDSKTTFGQRIADKLANTAGSWGFIICFGVVLVSWISINSIVLLTRPFDPFPFILLNLVLSCLAAIQAPVIMMSQNRQETRDRLHSEHDYQINLKAELEIQQLHEKVDHIMVQQWGRLAEIQQIQTDLMNELLKQQQS